MRIRNVKNKKEIINQSKLYVDNPTKYRGTWKKVFENNNPIYIEIGMGKGKFILESAKRFKNINFIGIEKEDSVLCRAIEKEEDVKNLRFINYDANKIEKLFDKEIDRIYLNFSDPWPKKRHEKRRLTSLNFLKKYDKIFKGYNEIFFKTDNKDLFSYSIESLTNYGYKLKNTTLNLENNDNNIETEYENKFRSQGVCINRLEAYKSNLDKSIAIIGAMKEEVAGLIEYYNLNKESDCFEIYTGRCNDKNIIVSQSGVGKVNSAMITQHIIDKYNPDLIINTGIAGSLDSCIKKMNVVMASILTYHDFEPFGIMKKHVGINGAIYQDNDIIIKASEILEKEKIESVSIPICSGDKFILDTKVKKKIREETNCLAIDMESASIGHVCFNNKVLSLIIRVVSDNSNDENYDEAKAAKKSCTVVTKIVDCL